MNINKGPGHQPPNALITARSALGSQP